MRTVAVYKTNVDDQSEAEAILDIIREQLPGANPNFDLEDCDNVLRVESSVGEIDVEKIKRTVEQQGFHADPLL